MGHTEQILVQFRDKRALERALRSRSAFFGAGTAASHHGEILQGAFEDESGSLVPALVTLHCPGTRTSAAFRYEPEARLIVTPKHKQKATRAVQLTLQYLGLETGGGVLAVFSEIEEEAGLGSSTSDVVAAIAAVCNSLGASLPASTIARIAVAAEEASDPLMYPDTTVLFAHRDGRVLEDLRQRMPCLAIVSTISGDPVNTTAFKPATYTWQEAQEYKPLIGLLRFALRSRSIELIGKVATRSAELNQRRLRKQHLDDIVRIAEQAGAAGVQVAHSGNRIGVIFDPDDADLHLRTIDAAHRLAACGLSTNYFFLSGT